jgi:PAS domain S-box-containing protein
MKPRRLYILFAGFVLAMALLGAGTWAAWRQFGRAESATPFIAAGIGVAVLLLIGTFALVVHEHLLRQRSQAQLDRFFTLSLDMLCIADTHGYFTRVSPSFTHTLGHAEEELLTKPFLDFVHPDDRAATLAEMDRLRQGVPTIRFENRYRCKDGSYRWLAWKTQPDKDAGVLYASARDVTHRRQAEEQITQLNADLQRQAADLAEANRELESFSYSVSHDLRAPLRSIDGFSQLLLEDCADHLSDDGKDALKRVRKAATTMGELIDALLGLSRVSRAELRVERVDLSALAATIAAELRESQPGRQVEFVIAPDLVVEADPRLFRAMLANLLDNAWKYTAQRAAARIEFGRTNNAGECAYFVRDNGVGFDMAYVGRLFGAFQRLHRQAEYAGTGIGLATVQRILHRHGGRAWAEAAPNEGATFYFTAGATGGRVGNARMQISW